MCVEELLRIWLGLELSRASTATELPQPESGVRATGGDVQCGALT